MVLTMTYTQIFRVVRAIARTNMALATAMARALHVAHRPRPYRGAHTCQTLNPTSYDVGTCPACWAKARRHGMPGGLQGEPPRVSRAALDEGKALVAMLVAYQPSQDPMAGPCWALARRFGREAKLDMLRNVRSMLADRERWTPDRCQQVVEWLRLLSS